MNEEVKDTLKGGAAGSASEESGESTSAQARIEKEKGKWKADALRNPRRRRYLLAQARSDEVTTHEENLTA